MLIVNYKLIYRFTVIGSIDILQQKAEYDLVRTRMEEIGNGRKQGTIKYRPFRVLSSLALVGLALLRMSLQIHFSHVLIRFTWCKR